MKDKLKHVLFIFTILFLIICMFYESVSSVTAACSYLNNEECDESCGKNENITENDKKIIYLTFDDGPSYEVSNEILDILKENDIKATFFLIGSEIKDKEDVVKRIHNEGHSIGLHTYTHNFKKIYSNEDKFIQEMMFCRSEIREVIGIAPNIIRFPGGSYKHLSKRYLKKLHDNNFRVYDWNMDNCDGLNPEIQPYSLYTRAIKGSNKLDNIILLMHCTDMNKNTCKALPKIINYYKSQEYEFKLITEDTAELYFPIKN